MDPQSILPKPVIWSLDAADACGLSGLPLDMRICQNLGVHPCTVALAQLTGPGNNQQLRLADEDYINAALESLARAFPPSLIKLGLLPSAGVVHLVADMLEDYQGRVIYDPVFTLGGGLFQLDRKLWELIRRRILPRVDVFTPTCKQLASVSGGPVDQYEDIEAATEQLLMHGVGSLLVKAGQLVGDPRYREDYHHGTEGRFWLRSPGVAGKPMPQGGRITSMALGAALAHGLELHDALVIAECCRNQGQRLQNRVGKEQVTIGDIGWPDKLDDLPKLIAGNPERWHKTRPIVERVDGLGLYPVVVNVDTIEALLASGVRSIQLRLPAMDETLLRREVQRAVKLCTPFGARLFISDHWQLALLYGAHGVHLEQADLPRANLKAIVDGGLHIGLSVSNWGDLAEALAIRPGYLSIEYEGSQAGFTRRLAHWVELLGNQFSLTVRGDIEPAMLETLLATGIRSIAPVNANTETISRLAQSFPGPAQQRAG